ncbi:MULTISPECIES: hypothetical protein [unclassified Burkholderia]|uniref:hypothetical protein n=1 Tax=unclassified Burkholderia TaxID=2613784 RepID=UPI000F58125F|nr:MULTISPECIES: hypothetical protein [unclassified Burkholderia]
MSSYPFAPGCIERREEGAVGGPVRTRGEGAAWHACAGAGFAGPDRAAWLAVEINQAVHFNGEPEILLAHFFVDFCSIG